MGGSVLEASARALDIDVGSCIGAYRLAARIREGGSGIVWRAVHVESGTAVALKTVRVHREPELASVRREIQALSRLQHPGVVRIVDHGVSDGNPWCAMELLEGQTLGTLIRTSFFGDRSGSSSGEASSGERSIDDEPETVDLQETETKPWLSHGGRTRVDACAGQLERFLDLIAGVCEPLAYIHGEGFVHRDLKPSNIFVREDGTPVLVDFGLAWLLQEREAGREVIAVDAARAGTVAYMAPEQVRGERVDARADLYSLGAVMYESVTGRTPYAAKTRSDLLALQRAAKPPRPSLLANGVTPVLDELIMRLLALRPRDRIGHAADVLRELQRLGVTLKRRGPKPRSYLYRPEVRGRETQVEELLGFTDETSRGKGRLVLVSGVSGIGKTTLVSEVARRAAEKGLKVVTGQCTAVAMDDGRGVRRGGPFYPFDKLLQAVADRCTSGGQEVTRTLLGERAKILSRSEPSLGEVPGAKEYPDPTQLPSEAESKRLLDSLEFTLSAFASERPLLLVLDDLQWADDLTLEFLRTLPSTFFERHPLLLLGTFRSEEAGPELEKLLGTPHLTKLQLEALDAQSIAEIASEMLGQMAPSPLVTLLTRQSAGSPFFAAEYLRTAVDAGLLYRDLDGHWVGATVPSLDQLPLPNTIRDLVKRRLDALSPHAQRLAGLAAVVGRELELDFLLTLVGATESSTDETLVSESLVELCARDVLEQSSESSFRFIHDTLREVAYDRIPSVDRRSVHLEVAKALVKRHQELGTLDRVYGALAHHFEAGGEYSEALNYFDLAGEAAHKTHAVHEAYGLLSKAKKLETQVATASPPLRRAQRERMLGCNAQDLGRGEVALRHLVEATIATGHPWPSSKRAVTSRALFSLARELGRRAVPLVSRDPAPTKHERDLLIEAARAYERLAIVSYFVSGDFASVALGALRNVDLAERAGGPSAELCLGYATVGTTCALAGLDRPAQYYARRAVEVAVEAGDPATETWAQINVAAVHIHAGRWNEVQSADERVRQLARGIGFQRRFIMGTIQLSSAWLLAGRFDESASLNDELTELVGPGDPQAYVWWTIRKSELALIRGNSSSALESALLGERLCENLGRPEWIYALGALTLAYLRSGDSARAREAADRAAEWIGQGTPIAYYNIFSYAAVAETYFELLEQASGPRERDSFTNAARRAVKEVCSIARVMRVGAPRAHYFRGIEALRIDRRPERARRCFEKSLRVAQQLDMPYDEAVALLALAQHSPTAGERTQLLTRANEIFERIDARHDLRRTRFAMSDADGAAA